MTVLSRLAATGAIVVSILASGTGSALAQPAVTHGAGMPAAGEHHLDAWWFDALHIEQAHRQTTGAGARVAITDDGFDTGLPGFRGVDTHFMKGCDGQSAHREKLDSINNHGTEMLMFLAGNGRGPGPGGRGYEGIAPGARVDLWPEQPYSGCDHEAERDQAVAAAEAGADIINVSRAVDGVDWGGSLKKIADAGAVVVAAAGNAPQGDTTLVAPAVYRGVVAVVAVDKNARPWKGNVSVSQSALDAGSGYPVVAAPGVDLEASSWFPRGGYSLSKSDGTSDSTAIVSGMLALVKAKYPDATANQLIQQLIHYTGGWQNGFGWTKEYGFGIASVTEMLKHDPTQWPDENPLLLTPAQVIKTYPMSVRGQKHVLDKPSPSPRSAGTAEAAPAPESSTANWLWPAGGVVALAAAVAVVVAMRRRGDAVAGETDRGVPDRREPQMRGD